MSTTCYLIDKMCNIYLTYLGEIEHKSLLLPV